MTKEVFQSPEPDKTFTKADELPGEDHQQLLDTQRKINALLEESDFLDEFNGGVKLLKERDAYIESAKSLPFDLVKQMVGHASYADIEKLNKLHDKFTGINLEDIEVYLQASQWSPDITLMLMRDVISQYAPHLLPNTVREVLNADRDPAAAVASLAVIWRQRFSNEDLTSIQLGNESNVSLGSLEASRQESIIRDRYSYIVEASRSEERKQEQDVHNRLKETVGMLENSGLVHATQRIEALRSILENGLLSGEGVIGNTRTGVVNFPFTVSFIKVAPTLDTNEKLEVLRKGDAYGPIKIVFKISVEDKDEIHIESNRSYQEQFFGGIPSTKIRQIIVSDEAIVGDTVQTLIEHEVYIPLFNGRDGSLILSPDEFDIIKSSHHLVEL
ncbi:TPA: hypothetical protein DD425_02060 [Candidatus Saccharibacteria bacterium]|nr:hypothetical protein [Candidatus Saccharibacteria bacterium]